MADQPKNPVIAGILSGILPGLGQFYCRQWGKGAGFLVVALVVDAAFNVSAYMLEVLRTFGSGLPTDGFQKFLLGSLLILAIAVWSIVDAVRTAQGSQP